MFKGRSLLEARKGSYARCIADSLDMYMVQHTPIPSYIAIKKAAPNSTCWQHARGGKFSVFPASPRPSYIPEGNHAESTGDSSLAGCLACVRVSQCCAKRPRTTAAKFHWSVDRLVDLFQAGTHACSREPEHPIAHLEGGTRRPRTARCAMRALGVSSCVN